MTTQAITDQYVECTECGHALEGHGSGCFCGCAPWARSEIEAVRRRSGLPGHYRAEEF